MDYFIADTHFFHENIIRYCNRPFKSVDEMNGTMIANWNSVVTDVDTVYHLGDFSMVRGDRLDFRGIYNSLNGMKVLVAGNHDHESVRKLFPVVLEDAVIRVGSTGGIKLRVRHIYGDDMDYRVTGIFPVFGHYHNNFSPCNLTSGGMCVSAELINYTPVSVQEVIAVRQGCDSGTSVAAGEGEDYQQADVNPPEEK